ncbi:unnamed protein product [Ranitomeya imitator]|uniref:Uncharacterized protein n=1 Tax=Ranitomeya imitator TaxID=111125 RepID=A0ABN9LD94_9NEOB|nr:unnamed protein product [Ranitomeya imitator]
MAEADIIEFLSLEKLVNDNKCLCQIEPCSAVLGYGKKIDSHIRKGLCWLLEVIAKDFEALHERVQKETTEQRAQEEQDKQKIAERVKRLREEREEREKEEAEREGATAVDEDKSVPMVNPFQPISAVVTENEEKLRKEKEKKRQKLVNGQNGVDLALEPKAQEEEMDSGSEGSESGRASQDGHLIDSYRDALAQKLEQDDTSVDPSERRESAQSKKKMKKLKMKRNNKVEPFCSEESDIKSPVTPPPQLPVGWEPQKLLDFQNLSLLEKHIIMRSAVTSELTQYSRSESAAEVNFVSLQTHLQQHLSSHSVVSSSVEKCLYITNLVSLQTHLQLSSHSAVRSAVLPFYQHWLFVR